MDPFVVVFAG